MTDHYSPRYYPQFWRQNRPFAKHLAERMQEAARRGGVKAAEHVLLDAIASAATAAGMPPRKLLENSLLSHEGLLAQSLAHWELQGSEVLDFTPSLVEALRHSDPGEMQLRDVLGEAERAIYLHFGPQAGLVMGTGQVVEGLLVLHTPESGYSRMMLVGRRAGGWLQEGTGQSQMLRFELATMAQLPFDEAVAAAVALDIEDVRQAREKLKAEHGDQLVTSDAAFDEVVSSQERNAAAYTHALRLAGNALAYLSAYPEDQVEDWQPDTPASLRFKASLPGKEGARANSKLRSMGYRKVRLIGGEFELADAKAHTGTGPRSPHWRTGHWRRQAHGPQMSLRKLIWIRPMRVLGRLEDATPAMPASLDPRPSFD